MAIIKAVTEIKRHATEIIAQLREDRTPVVVTEHGRSAAVLIDIESYTTLMDRIDTLEGIARGERAFAEGRVISHTAAKRRLSRWLAPA